MPGLRLLRCAVRLFFIRSSARLFRNADVPFMRVFGASDTFAFVPLVLLVER